MSRSQIKATPADAFDRVRTVGLALPGVEAATKYDGSPMLKLNGCFLAGLATHKSAEPGTLVVRTSLEEREWLIQDAPQTYYLTSYYRRHPVLLVRLEQVNDDILRELLKASWRLTSVKRSSNRLNSPPAPRPH